MLDQVQEQTTLTPREPEKVCTLLADGTLVVMLDNIRPLDLQRLLLGAAGQLTERALNRSSNAEQLLASIQARFQGFDQPTQQAIERVLTRPVLA